MQLNSETTNIDKGTAAVPCHKEVKTTECTINSSHFDDDPKKKISWFQIKIDEWYNSPVALTTVHFFTLFVLGLLTWGLLWSAWGEGWSLDGDWFRLAAVPVVAWTSGQVLQAVTGLPPLLAALLTGILARNFDILDLRHFTDIDVFLRRVYPVVILGKASLGWNVKYMRDNWQQVAALGVIPWIAEVVTLAGFTNFVLGFPWTWGFLLGSVYASVSCAVVMPTVQKVAAGSERNWAQLICTAGGTDTALSVGVYGLIFSYMFVETDAVYRNVKAGLTLFVGVALGVIWGRLAGLIPHSGNYYMSEMRVLFVLVGGLFANFFTSNLGWGGTGGVAVLACNATAATYWARSGWPLNNNPASTAYRVLWAALEPILFAYTGTFFVINTMTLNMMINGLAILFISLFVRLTVTAAVCWDMSLKERMFVCCTWIPKSIVEAVLSPVAINMVIMGTSRSQQKEYAESLLQLLVQAILITTPIGYLLTNYLGPWLLRKPQKDYKNEPGPNRKSFTGSHHEEA